jgi:aryl-alcohol dehydrogenase-like predicted oxidoreductase
LNSAIDRGINFIDTALAYGPHHSERLIGRVVRSREEEVYVATKVPPKNLQWPALGETPVEEVFPGSHIRHCVERSLRNLGTEVIDLLQLHAWRDEWLGTGDWAETIEALRTEGKIRFFGISTNDQEPQSATGIAASGLVDTVQVIYNIFEQTAGNDLLPACVARDVGVIARAPLDEGALTGAITTASVFGDDEFRAAYFRGERRREIDEHVRSITADLGIERSHLADVALRFVLAHPAVSTVIPGMRSVRHVERNCASAAAGSLSSEQLELLTRHRWEKNFYN